MIRAFLLSTGSDGDSHVFRGHVAAKTSLDVRAMHFEETAAGSSLDWHTAPTAQFVITLSGTLEFVTRGGETFVIAPGDVLIALDTTGSGHRWRLVDDQPWKRTYVTFAGDARDIFVSDQIV